MRGLDVVHLVQHFAEQGDGHVHRFGAGLAAALGLVEHLAVDPLGLVHAALHGIAEADQAAPLQRTARRAEQRGAVDRQHRAFELDTPRFLVVAVMHAQPRAQIDGAANRRGIGALRRVHQLRQHRQRPVGVVTLDGEEGAYQGQAEAVFPVVVRNIPVELFHAFDAGGELAGVDMHARLNDAQADVLADLLGRQLADQFDEYTQVALCIQRFHTAFDQPRRRLRFSAGYGMAHRFVQVSVLAEPHPRPCMHAALFFLAARFEMLEQVLAQQRVQAIPVFRVGAVDGDKEQVVAFQPRQQRHCIVFGATAQRGAQRSAEAVAHRHVQEQFDILPRQARQHLALEEAGERLGVAQLHRRLAGGLALLAAHGKQLQAGDPAVAEVMQQAGVAGVDIAQLRLKELLRFLRGEAQVAQVQFQREVLAAQPRQRQRHRTARGQDQVQVGRCVVEQPLQGFVDGGVGEGMQVVEHQHHFARVAGDAAHQGDYGALDAFAVDTAAFQQGGIADDLRRELGEAGEQVVEETGEVVVVLGEGQPGDVEAEGDQLLPPGQQHGGLAPAGRPFQHDAAAPTGFQQLFEQAFAGDDAGGTAWRHQLAAVDRVQRTGRGENGARCAWFLLLFHERSKRIQSQDQRSVPQRIPCRAAISTPCRLWHAAPALPPDAGGGGACSCCSTSHQYPAQTGVRCRTRRASAWLFNSRSTATSR
ncbi:hypothetical protein D3C78_649910 [compost metagenome]